MKMKYECDRTSIEWMSRHEKDVYFGNFHIMWEWHIEKLEGVSFDGHPTNEYAPLHKRLIQAHYGALESVKLNKLTWPASGVKTI